MGKVYFKAVDSYSNTEEVSNAAEEILKKLIEEENIKLEKYIPLKVHFGEKGNVTFISSKNFHGIIKYLKEKQIKSSFMETNALYRGERNTSEKHIGLALEHGFTELPIVIADGEYGENYKNVEINKKHFKSCKIGADIEKEKQIIVISHFKGHALAGFGGAIKQLGMGCAARGGKLDQHANSTPKVNIFKCRACGACSKKCPVNAIIMNRKAKIDKKKCVGCASCMAICPHKAISSNWLASITRSFNERLTEYAFAAQKGKSNIYITFALNITNNCDCEGHVMHNIARDIGVFASTDPVSIDQACLDMLDKKERRTVFIRGRYTLNYAEKIGLGSRKYELKEIK
ncbi:MAG: hypothetical protein K0R54_471 [Clostridiaceae bacterium]|jgi:uncharacterized Fe-S center protein|nr:hypothetical protein [Clostridiaceae bacterium]